MFDKLFPEQFYGMQKFWSTGVPEFWYGTPPAPEIPGSWDDLSSSEQTSGAARKFWDDKKCSRNHFLELTKKNQKSKWPTNLWVVLADVVNLVVFWIDLGSCSYFFVYLYTLYTTMPVKIRWVYSFLVVYYF